MPKESKPTAPIRAYSYLRCSTPEQMLGDSFRRQIALAEAYAAKRGWQMDTQLNLRDIGVSAFRGRNAIDGNLGLFLEHVTTGEVPPGSVLLVESLDRLSRQEIGEAQLSFLNLLRSGIRVVTLLDEQEYSWESVNAGDGMVRLIVSLTIMSRAHEESATKARRLKEAWAEKRSRIESGEALTSRVPAWMQLNRETGEIELIPERAAVVQRIYSESLDGKGQHQIAYGLNSEKVPTWGRSSYWQRSYIAKILENEAVIGTFTPHTIDYVDSQKKRTPQEPIRGYYPAAISEGLWAEVQARNAGKGARQRGASSGRPVSHMLARLARCPECGGTMTRVMKGSRSRPSLVCSKAKNKAGCTYRSVRVDIVEEAIVERLPERLRDAPAGDRDRALDQEIIDKTEALSDVSERLNSLVAAIEKGGDALTLTTRIRELEGEYEEARDALRRLEARRAETTGATVHKRIERLVEALNPEKGDPLDVAEVNAFMLAVFDSVTVDYSNGVLDFLWLHGGGVELPYALPSRDA